MKRFFYLCTIMSFLSCSEDEKAVPFDPTYDLWSQLLNSTFIHEDTRLLVLDDFAFCGYIGIVLAKYDYVKSQIPQLDSSQVVKLIALNQVAQPLKRQFDLDVLYKFFTTEDNEALIDTIPWSYWDNFYKRFPGSTGCITLSIPCIADDSLSAILCTEISSDFLSASGVILYLEKEGKDWEVKNWCRILYSR